MNHDEYLENVKTVNSLKDELRRLNSVAHVEEKMSYAKMMRRPYDTYFETSWKTWKVLSERFRAAWKEEQERLLALGLLKFDQDPMTCPEYREFLGYPLQEGHA